jgi:hypothetical protein
MISKLSLLHNCTNEELNLLAHRQLRFGNPLSPDQNSRVKGNGNPRLLTYIAHPKF